MNKNNEMKNYYAKRASEYEDIYSIAERQEWIKKSKILLKNYFNNKNTLEIACGTGFWTETLSEASKNILATDINDEVLEIAKNKKYHCKVDFIQDDSYQLNKITEKYNALFAGFWFSHIPKSKINDFLDTIHKRLDENATIVFMDNLYIEGSSTPISRWDEEGNSYQIRKLKDDSRHEILKNFYDKSRLENCFGGHGKAIEIHELKYYWMIKYIKK